MAAMIAFCRRWIGYKVRRLSADIWVPATRRTRSTSRERRIDEALTRATSGHADA